MLALTRVSSDPITRRQLTMRRFDKHLEWPLVITSHFPALYANESEKQTLEQSDTILFVQINKRFKCLKKFWIWDQKHHIQFHLTQQLTNCSEYRERGGLSVPPHLLTVVGCWWRDCFDAMQNWNYCKLMLIMITSKLSWPLKFT